MAKRMSCYNVCAILFLIIVIIAEADPNPSKVAKQKKPKRVHCKDNKRYPVCNQKYFSCPAACPQSCIVDCVTCKPVCTPPPPPPPKAQKPKNVKCNNKNYPACYKKKDLYCPVSCPKTCSVDCATCLPVCTLPPSSTPLTPYIYSSPPPPPPPPSSSIPTTPPPSSTPPSSTPPTPYIYSSPPPPPPSSSIPTTPPPSSTPPTPYIYSTPPPPSSSVPTTPPSSPTPPNPPPESSGLKKARCKNKNFDKCYMIEHTCPNACPDHCEVDCVTCSPVCNCNKPGAVCQDPRFVGADGITFYFHGKKNKAFCIVSDPNLHINAHFIGKRNNNMQRDFTWVQSLGILFDTHQLFVGAKRTSTWDDKIDRLALTFDGEPLLLAATEGAKWHPTVGSGVSIARTRDVNSVEIQVEGNFKIIATVMPITKKESAIHSYGIDEEDCFAHLDLSFKFYSLSGDVNGVLGQTYGNNYVSRAKMGVLMPVLGGDREFASSSLFSTDCSVSRFYGTSNSSEIFEYGNLSCASGADGQGVVCKR